MNNVDIDWDSIDKIIANALDEDIASGDITTNAIFPPDEQCEAYLVAKEEGVVAGVEVAKRIFQKLDNKAEFTNNLNDGDSIETGQEILRINAQVRAVLSGERLALNVLQRMSGIATETSRYVEALKDYNTKILDTRKTAPGLRVLDKYAVLAGGGENHRFGLFDAVLIKDNHINTAGSIENAVDLVRTKYGDEFRVEVETTNVSEVEQALTAGVDIIMLDNMSTSMMKEAVQLVNGQALTEASGNITLGRIAEIADVGVDYISVGAITHSVRALDISLYMV